MQWSSRHVTVNACEWYERVHFVRKLLEWILRGCACIPACRQHMSAHLYNHYCKPFTRVRWCSTAVREAFGSHSSCPSWAAARKPRSLSTSAKSPVNQQLNWVLPENRKEVAQILDLAERAAARWDVSYSTFISPSVLADARLVLEGRSDVLMVPWGGYPQAERCRVAFGREEVLLAAKEDPAQLEDAVAALQVKGNFMFDPASHRDFLGAILGTGVDRDRVGDILVQGEAGAQILVDPELVEHFEASLTQVRTVPVETRCVALSDLRVPPPRREEVRSVEASLRLDALASAGFRMSRAKMGDLIKAGDVRVNWRPASKPALELKAGDLVSCTGKGRLEIVSISTTKKERYAVDMVRYV